MYPTLHESARFSRGMTLKDCFGILSINRNILLENKFFYGEGVALQMIQSFAFEFSCENFQPKLINSYSNFKRLFHFLLCDLGSQRYNLKSLAQFKLKTLTSKLRKNISFPPTHVYLLKLRR
jgi:hypothetical protein